MQSSFLEKSLFVFSEPVVSEKGKPTENEVFGSTIGALVSVANIYKKALRGLKTGKITDLERRYTQ